MTSGDGAADHPDGARPQSFAAQVAKDLREEILTGRLRPGQRISQQSIAERYGVSRLPAREALQELASQGLVAVERARSARIAALDDGDLREVCILREVLEPVAVELAVPHVTDEDIARAESVLAELEKLRTSDEGRLQLDREFHAIWYSRIQMPRLTGTIDELWDVARRYRALFSRTPESGGVSDLEHRLLLEAVRRGSAKDASAILHMHLGHMRQALLPSDSGHDLRQSP